MRRLIPHPESFDVSATQVEVEAVRSRASGLVVTYVVTGRIDNFVFPSVTTAARRDELWRHTCFEAFIRGPTGAAYFEFNFAPSTEWAAYRLDDYRSGLRTADEIAAVTIDVQTSPGRFALRAALDLDGVPGLPRDAAWRLGLSALLEDTRGRMSWWALAHPPGKPDFHHADGFAHELAPCKA